MIQKSQGNGPDWCIQNKYIFIFFPMGAYWEGGLGKNLNKSILILFTHSYSFMFQILTNLHIWRKTCSKNREWSPSLLGVYIYIEFYYFFSSMEWASLAVHITLLFVMIILYTSVAYQSHMPVKHSKTSVIVTS